MLINDLIKLKFCYCLGGSITSEGTTSKHSIIGFTGSLQEWYVHLRVYSCIIELDLPVLFPISVFITSTCLILTILEVVRRCPL